MSDLPITIIGAGAAGYFAAINCAQKNSDKTILLFEASTIDLAKVKISGGGRCNVTHNCFDPKAMSEHYPRGSKELLGPLNHFGSKDTVEWFESRGVALKTEEDGRMFPVTDLSQTVIELFRNEAKKYGVQLNLRSKIKSIYKEEDTFHINMDGSVSVQASKVLLCPGGSPQAFLLAEKLGHNIISPVPSLFTFNCSDKLIQDLQGNSFPKASIRYQNKSKFESRGPLLITHKGFSGPATLKLSSLAAFALADIEYKFKIRIDFLCRGNAEELADIIKKIKMDMGKKSLMQRPFMEIPKRFWESLLEIHSIDKDSLWADLKSEKIKLIAGTLSSTEFEITGRNAFKEEFVLAGGVDCKEVNFKTMESKKVSGLYFAGEILNIDGLTGGFNFQIAWTTAWIASQNM